MKFYVTDALFQQHLLELPVTDDITWNDFVNLQQVKSLPQPITDITPETLLKEKVSSDEDSLDLDRDDSSWSL